MKDARKKGRGFIEVEERSAGTMPGASTDGVPSAAMPRGDMTSPGPDGPMPSGMRATLAASTAGAPAGMDTGASAGGGMPAGRMEQGLAGAPAAGGGVSAALAATALELPGTWRLTLTPVSR